LELVILPREKETLRLRSAELAIVGVLIAFSLFLPSILSARAEEPLAEPSLVTVLNTLGYTNIALSSVQTFPAGTYETKLLAEFAGYHATNDFSYYPVGTNDFMLIFSGPEGNEGYVTPPITKTFSCNTTIGFSMYVGSESHRYFTETSLNPDGLQHAEIYVNLDDPDMYFIGFENLYDWGGDRDFQDMVVSIELIQHYLTVQTQPLGITTILGDGWYSNGTDVGLTAPDTVPISTGVRYNFSYWDIDGISQGAGVTPITVHMDANHTATAHYTLQSYLTVTSPYDTPSGQGWFDSGSIAYATLDTGTVDHGNGTRRLFTSWNGDASGTDYAQSDPILMNGPKTAIALWKTQYYLTMSTNFGTVNPGSGWYDAGSTFPINATPPSAVSGERYVWNGWTGTGNGSHTGTNNPASITMNAPIDEVASWTHQYYLTVTSPYDSPTPTSEWFNAETSITASVTSPWAGAVGTRYVCTGWTGTGSVPSSGSSASAAFTINAPSSITWNWKTQYYLTLTHTSGGATNPTSSGWYDAGTNGSVLAIPDPSYMLYRWELDGSPVGSTNPYDVPMSSAHALHAVFDYAVGGSTAAVELHLTHTWMGINSILAGAFCVAAFCTKKRRKRV
jgi:hypothetical protein